MPSFFLRELLIFPLVRISEKAMLLFHWTLVTFSGLSIQRTVAGLVTSYLSSFFFGPWGHGLWVYEPKMWFGLLVCNLIICMDRVWCYNAQRRAICSYFIKRQLRTDMNLSGAFFIELISFFFWLTSPNELNVNLGNWSKYIHEWTLVINNTAH